MIHRGRALLALAVAAIALAACYQAPAPVVQKDGDASGFPAPEAKPGAPDGTPAPGGGAGVVVARGDTLFEIAREQDVPLRDLIELNRLSPPYTLLVGQVLKLPGQRVHVVEKGDTVYAISRRYDIAMSSLVRLNGIEPPYTLYVGDTLSLPASTRPASAVVAVPAGEVTAAALLPPEPTAAIIVAPAPTPAAAPAPAETAAIPAAAPEVAPPPASPVGFSWPAGGTIISGFGPKPGNLHNDGVNIALAKGHTRSRRAWRHGGLCGQRTEGLRQPRADPPRGRLGQCLRPQRCAAGEPRPESRPGRRGGLRGQYGQRGLAPAPFRTAKRGRARRSGQVPGGVERGVPSRPVRQASGPQRGERPQKPQPDGIW